MVINLAAMKLLQHIGPMYVQTWSVRTERDLDTQAGDLDVIT